MKLTAGGEGSKLVFLICQLQSLLSQSISLQLFPSLLPNLEDIFSLLLLFHTFLTSCHFISCATMFTLSTHFQARKESFFFTILYEERKKVLCPPIVVGFGLWHFGCCPEGEKTESGER